VASIPESIPLTELGHDVEALLKRLRDSPAPIVLTEGGVAVAMMLSIDAHKRGEDERQLLLELLRGEQDIAHGDVYDLDTVMAEADALLG
jgi:hypothetical protein